MASLVLLGITAFVAALFLTPLIRNISLRLGVVDQPDERKQHKIPIPRVGGIAVVLSYIIGFLVLLAVNAKSGDIIWSARTSIWHLLPAILVIFLVGVVDDIVGLRPLHKLGGQLVAASLAYSAGVAVTGFAGNELPMWLSLPVTLFWLVACTNAVNLIDGVDGLATGVGLFATTTTLLAALLQHNAALALATAPLVGALLGFLRFNFNPATVFLGDSGSLFVGFLLGCFGILWSQKSATMLGMTAPLIALAIPLLDTSLAIARRFIHNKPIFGADRGHIHHRLLDRGLTPRKVALILYGACAVGAAFSLGVMNSQSSGIAIVLFCVAAWIGVQHLGYVEFGVAGRMFVEGAFRRQLSGQLAIRAFEARLAASKNIDQAWEIICEAGQRFGFQAVRMVYGGTAYNCGSELLQKGRWTVSVPLGGEDFLELQRVFNLEQDATAVAPFADIVWKVAEKSRWGLDSGESNVLETVGKGDKSW